MNLRPLRGSLAAAFVLLLSALLVSAPPAASPAYAAKSFCTTSIDPRCQPQNLPILIELGIVSAEGSTATTAAVGGSVAAGGAATAPLALGSGAAVGMGGFGICALLWEGVCTPGYLGEKGLAGQIIKTDPAWSNASAGTKVCGTTGSTVVVQASGRPEPMLTESSATMEPGCDHLVLGGTQWSVTGVDLTGANPVITVARTSASTSTVVLRRWCAEAGGGVNGVGSVASISAGSSTPLTFTDTASACAGGKTLVYAITGLTFGSTIPFYVLYGNGHVYTAPGPNSITGTMSGTVDCASPTGSHTVTFSSSVDVTAGADIALPDVLCDPGEVATGIEIEFAPSTGGTPVEVVPPTAPAPSIGNLPVDYPDCFGPLVGGCRLGLWKLGTGGQLDFCGSIGQLCVGWSSTPGAETQYQCRYGDYVMPLNACSAFRDPTVGVLPNFSPTTDDWIPYNAPTPVPLPNDTGTGTIPGTDVYADPTYEDCWPSGWGVFNPLAWVYQPVKCAMQWLFIPRQAALTAVQVRIDTAIAESAPGTIAETFVAADWSGITSGGCQGVLIDMTWLQRDAFADADFPDSLTIANACPGSPLEPYAAFSSLLVVGGVIMACFRTWPALLGRIFNYGGVDGS